jgi:hypothetical protein
MTAPSTPFHPFVRLVRITILDRAFELPENNLRLRAFQHA